MKFFLLLFFLFISLMTTQGFAATFTVTTVSDSGAGSLRATVESANTATSDDTIIFAPGLTTITLSSQIQINNSGTLTITGPGANTLTIDGGPGTNRIFNVNNATVTIQRVTLSGGGGSDGFGAALNSIDGTTTLEEIVVQNNVGNSIGNGAVNIAGGTNHRIANSTFSDNTGFMDCAAIYGQGAPLTIVNTTVSGNSTVAAGAGAGAVCFSGGSGVIRNTTISGNTAGGAGAIGGGGIYLQASATVNLGNTIVAGNNTANRGPDLYRFDSATTFTSSGGNLIGDNSGNPSAPNTAAFPAGNPNANGDKVGTAGSVINPMLGALSIANGGTTPTRSLLAGSPAIDSGINSLATAAGLTTDQRGLARVVDGNNDTVATVDIGAYEAQLAPTAATVSVSGYVTTISGTGIRGVRLSLTDSQGNVRTTATTSDGYYHFDDVQVGETYILSASGKRYTFSQSLQVLNINEETNEINFTANSEKRLRVF